MLYEINKFFSAIAEKLFGQILYFLYPHTMSFENPQNNIENQESSFEL